VPERRIHRRLAAILAADVVGYSALMERAEEATYAEFERLKRHLIEPSLARHDGRLIKTTGDGALAEFASPLAAVRCAIDIQEHLALHSSRFKLRVGLNLGDVIVGQDGDLYGDGINIAVRLEGIADPGGILISEKVYSEVEGKLDAAFEDRGERQLKNIAKPVRAYSVCAGAHDEQIANKRAAPSLPDKPSIAVLPFQNMSGDPEQEFFADGLVEDIITALSRFRGLLVIARNSSFTYKGKAVDIRQVGRELGARYVLEGSVRKAGTRLRVVSQLIDVTTGMHLWADRFDGALEDIFDLQDKLTFQVVGAIAPEVDRSEIERANRKIIGNVDAVTEYYRGLPQIYFPTGPERIDAAIEHFKNSMALDPSFAPAYGGMAACISWRRANKWPGDTARENAQLLQLAQRIKELGTDDAVALYAIGFALFFCNVDHEAGTEMVDRAIRFNPNFATAYGVRGFLRVWDGEGEAAISDFERNMRLSPRDPFMFNTMIGLAFGCCNAGRYEEAAAWTDKSIRAFPPNYLAGIQVAIFCYMAARRKKDAERLAVQCVHLFPQWRRSNLEWNGVRSPDLRKRMLNAFIEAGMPE
jgi:TolB-like protein